MGNRTLSSYTYNARSLPQTMTYGNGVVVSYGYDNLNRQTEFYVNNWLKYEYNYDGYSRLSELVDYSLHRKMKYEYDILGRPASEKIIDAFTNYIVSKLSLRYDDSKNRLAGYDVSIGNTTNSTDYTYGGNSVAPDLISGVKLNGTQKISYTYDGLNRLSTRNLNNFLTEYTYFQDDLNQRATTIVSSMKNGNDTLAYIYDELGNITSISKNGILVESYTYDALNQLKTVTRGTDTYTYNYDNGGNILSVTKNGQTVKSYTYGDTEWKDLLTAYNGQTITYDNIGNPLTYYNGSTFTWSDGRKLTGVTKGTDNISYTYDSNGLRTSKTVNGTTTEYYWLDGTLYAEKTGNQYIYYHYDDNGIAYGFTVVNGTTTTDYYYIHNLQGDVIGIVDSTGTTVVEYTYDEWGKILATTGSLATTIGELNPLRYRGYYYDTETGFYYCRARYYDPEICRWINGDSYASTGQGMLSFNMFAYCLNNPVILTDSTGLCSYNGTYADFIRLNQGLPSMDCVCKIKNAIENTEIVLTNDNGTINAQITVSLDETPELVQMIPSETSEYARWINKRLQYYASTPNVLDNGQIKQLFGEIMVHIYGWKTKRFHNYDENCRVINIDIINGSVSDSRGWIDMISVFLGEELYVEEKP